MTRYGGSIGEFATSYSAPGGGVVVVDRPHTIDGPANSTSIDACLTRAMIDVDGTGAGSSFLYDKLGCMIDPVSGRRVNPVCWGPSARSDCIESRVTSESFMTQLARFVPVAQEIFAIAIPIVGSHIGEIITPIINDVVGTGESMLSEELKSFLKMLGSFVVKIEGYVGDIESQFKRIGFSAKTMIDALPSSIAGVVSRADASVILSYIGTRDSLISALGISEGIVPNIGSIEALAESGIDITSLSDAMRFRDARKHLLGMQASINGLEDLRGTLTPDKFRNFVGDYHNIAPIEGFSVDQIRALNLPGDGMSIATATAQAYAGKGALKWSATAKQALDQLDPAKLASIVPIDQARASFVAKLNESLAFGRAIEAAVKAADQGLQSDLDGIRIAMDNNRQFESTIPGISKLPREEYQARLRSMISDAFSRADETVQNAVRAAAGAKKGKFTQAVQSQSGLTHQENIVQQVQYGPSGIVSVTKPAQTTVSTAILSSKSPQVTKPIVPAPAPAVETKSEWGKFLVFAASILGGGYWYMKRSRK